MRIVITSDTHFGDSSNQLATKKGNNAFELGSLFNIFCEVAEKHNDYLVLLGDIIDVAIEDYKDAFDTFKFFLQEIIKRDITKTIIYIPGNHDYDVWHAIEYQANIIKRIVDHRITRLFRMSVPAVLDDRGDTSAFFLGNVTRRESQAKPYGGLFLSELTNNALEFYIGFPNMYLVTNKGDCILLTHGQYFQTFWSLGSDWAPKIFQDKLSVQLPLCTKSLAQLNFPLSQLSSSGVGQAGPLTERVKEIQSEFKSGDTKNIEIYLGNLKKAIYTELIKAKWYNPADWLKKGAIRYVEKQIIKAIKKGHSAPRDNESWEMDPNTQQKMIDYYLSSCQEIMWINERTNQNIPERPSKLIFGHTHRPIPIEGSNLSISPYPEKPVPIYNTGSWLEKSKDGSMEFRGAEVFIYESVQGLKSVRISKQS